ncbi:MAG: prepilin-type N-terminal cleavage/methylation domain-containing protein [Planctomycetaceae bacterium]|nr:prepilin-type N-terminal cleavage/methylation domain-containing protein [Planctomycetaceae bacterium]
MFPPTASTICPRRRTRCGLSLIELLITLAIISILAAMLIPRLGEHVPDQLLAASEIVAADLEYARSLAVANNSKYRVTFAPGQNLYVLRHSGSNTLLDVLPASPFRQQSDAPNQQTTDLADLPLAHPLVTLHCVVATGGSTEPVSDVEFTPLGGTTRTELTTVWLACASGTERRFTSITINAATGLVEIGELVKALPANVAAVVQAQAPVGP